MQATSTTFAHVDTSSISPMGCKVRFFLPMCACAFVCACVEATNGDSELLQMLTAIARNGQRVRALGEAQPRLMQLQLRVEGAVQVI